MNNHKAAFNTHFVGLARTPVSVAVSQINTIASQELTCTNLMVFVLVPSLTGSF